VLASTHWPSPLDKCIDPELALWILSTIWRTKRRIYSRKLKKSL
jgi:hypothetical protein